MGDNDKTGQQDRPYVSRQLNKWNMILAKNNVISKLLETEVTNVHTQLKQSLTIIKEVRDDEWGLET